MGLSPFGQGLIMSGVDLLGQGLNNASTARQNRLQRQWNEKMYYLQRQHNLSDWQLQNEYNSPEEQMKRLKLAGLNPNLVYNNGATTQAAPVKSSDVKPWNPQPQNWQLGSAMSKFYDVQIQKQQADNLRQQNTLLMQESFLKAAQTMATLATTDKTKQDIKTSQFDLMMKETLKTSAVDAAIAEVKNKQAQTLSTLDANTRNNLLFAPTKAKLLEEIYTIQLQRAKTNQEIEYIKEQLKNIKADTQLKEQEIEFRKMGGNPNNPWYVNMIARAVAGGAFSTRSIVDQALDLWRRNKK